MGKGIRKGSRNDPPGPAPETAVTSQMVCTLQTACRGYTARVAFQRQHTACLQLQAMCRRTHQIGLQKALRAIDMPIAIGALTDGTMVSTESTNPLGADIDKIHAGIVTRVKMIIRGLLILIFMALACMIFVFVTWYCLNQTLVVSMQRMHEQNEALSEQNRQMNADLLHFTQTLQQIHLLAQAHNASRVEPVSVLDTSRIETAIANIAVLDTSGIETAIANIAKPVNVAGFAVTKIVHDRLFFELAMRFSQPVAFVWTAGFWTAYNFIDEKTTEWLFDSLEPVLSDIGVWVGSGLAHTTGAVLSVWFGN